MTYFSQMVGLTVQNFLSAAVGIVVAVALIRGIVGRSGKSLGNFWQDLVRTVLYVLLPISFVSRARARLPGRRSRTSRTTSRAHGITGVAQTIAMGPVASQEAIKELGTNGGGFFNVNSAHPFENPNGVHQLLRDAAGAGHPGGAGLHLRADGRHPPPGLRDLRDDVRDVPRRASSSPTSPRRTARRPSTRPACTPRVIARLDRRQHGGQGAALRHRRLGAVRRRHDRHLVRRRQQRDRVLHRARRRGARSPTCRPAR